MAIKEILLVDNKTPIIAAIGFILQDQGHLVMVAPDPVTASVELGNYNFDLMLVYLSGLNRRSLPPQAGQAAVASNPHYGGGQSPEISPAHRVVPNRGG